LFDAFTLTLLPADLYYQAEQSLDPIIGTSAGGPWELEVLDNRTGAALNASLVSWQLEFIFANTNIAATFFDALTGGVAATNSLGAGGLGYYTVVVPALANFATNILLSSDQPVNVWFSTNFPPTIGQPGDALLLANATSGIGNPILSTNSSPALPVPGTYYLVIQNTNNVAATFGVQVNFDLPGFNGHLQLIGAKSSAGQPQMKWSALRGVHYKVQWADQIANPTVWHTITNPATIFSNGVSTFTDNGAQTAPLGPKRFYRLVKP
jgi:hypothetical protein